MNVITISRLLNSGGLTIGRRVADELGYSFVTKETIEKVMSQFGMVDFDAVYESAPGLLDRLDRYEEEMVTFMRRVIKALAVHGRVVIVGRGSFSVFPGYSEVLNVRLWAPLDVRVRRYMESTHNRSWRECLDEVTAHDKVRAAFVHRWLHAHPDKSNAFDLVINTAKIPQDMAVRLIVDSARENKDLLLEGHRTLKDLEIDPVLMKTVNNVLG